MSKTKKIPGTSSIISSFSQSLSGDKASGEGNVSVGIDDLYEEEIEEEEEEEYDDIIKIKSAKITDFNFICCIFHF